MYHLSRMRFVSFSVKRSSIFRLFPALASFCATERYVRVVPLYLHPVSRFAAHVSTAFASSRFTACSSGVMYTVCWWV